MKFIVRFLSFAVISASVMVADIAYQHRRIEPDATAAAIAQVNGGDAARQELETTRQRSAMADLATGGAMLVAAALCFATWRPRPTVTFVDQRQTELPKASV